MQIHINYNFDADTTSPEDFALIVKELSEALAGIAPVHVSTGRPPSAPSGEGSEAGDYVARQAELEEVKAGYRARFGKNFRLRSDQMESNKVSIMQACLSSGVCNGGAGATASVVTQYAEEPLEDGESMLD